MNESYFPKQQCNGYYTFRISRYHYYLFDNSSVSYYNEMLFLNYRRENLSFILFCATLLFVLLLLDKKILRNVEGRYKELFFVKIIQFFCPKYFKKANKGNGHTSIIDGFLGCDQSFGVLLDLHLSQKLMIQVVHVVRQIF